MLKNVYRAKTVFEECMRFDEYCTVAYKITFKIALWTCWPIQYLMKNKRGHLALLLFYCILLGRNRINNRVSCESASVRKFESSCSGDESRGSIIEQIGSSTPTSTQAERDEFNAWHDNAWNDAKLRNVRESNGILCSRLWNEQLRCGNVGFFVFSSSQQQLLSRPCYMTMYALRLPAIFGRLLYRVLFELLFKAGPV